MNSLKDLYLLLEEENLPSPTHQTDRRGSADEQPLSPTIKVERVTHTMLTPKHMHPYMEFPCSLVVERREQHSG